MRKGRQGRVIIFGALAVLLVVASTGSLAMADRIEEPRYETLVKDGDFEVRRYAPRIVARTEVKRGFRDSMYTGFRRLANFIFGANSASQEIAMTAPVGQIPTAEGYAVTFTMPSQFSMAALPRPNDGRVQLDQRPARVVAVVQFSGWARERRAASKERKLRDWMASRGLRPGGPAEVAQYDPPWRPLGRRNEVQVPLIDDSSSDR